MSLRIVPLGGLGEIGMNCMILESSSEILVIDCGLLFSDLEHFGVEFVIPDFTYLVERKDKVRGIVLTHGHEDHIGALPFLLRAGIQAPVYASPFTALMVEERLKEHTHLRDVEIRVFESYKQIKFKDFKVEPIPVNHSIVEAHALAIDTPVGTVVHTGDFKIDPTPYYGEELRIDRFKKLGDAGVVLLMSDSTNVERHEHSTSERMIMDSFERLFATAEGMVVISQFSSNIGRLGQILELAEKMGRKVAIAGRSMETNVHLARSQGYLSKGASQLVTLEELDAFPRNRRIVISTGSQGEFRSALSRMAYEEHPLVKLGKGDRVIMSSKFIPGNEKAIGRLINELFRQGAHVFYESVHDIHVSGHATRPELKTMLEAVRPKHFIPIHGEYRHLVHHVELARECGLSEAQSPIINNGDVVELSPNAIRVVERLEETRVLVEGRDGQELTRLMLKDRRQLGEKGIVFSILIRNSKTRRILAGPEILTKGLVRQDEEGHWVDEAKEHMERWIQKRMAREDSEEDAPSASSSIADLQEAIRIELRRFFGNALGKKPTVLPIVIDL